METGQGWAFFRRHPVLVAFCVGVLLSLCLTGCGADSRGAEAVAKCRPHGGVAALDDTVVICDNDVVVHVDDEPQ